MLTDTCRVLTGIADVSVDRRQLLGDKFGGSFDISGRVRGSTIISGDIYRVSKGGSRISPDIRIVSIDIPVSPTDFGSVRR